MTHDGDGLEPPVPLMFGLTEGDRNCYRAGYSAGKMAERVKTRCLEARIHALEADLSSLLELIGKSEDRFAQLRGVAEKLKERK